RDVRSSGLVHHGEGVLSGTQSLAGRLLSQLSQHDLAVVVSEVFLGRQRPALAQWRGRSPADGRLHPGGGRDVPLDAMAWAIVARARQWRAGGASGHGQLVPSGCSDVRLIALSPVARKISPLASTF